MLDPQEQRAIEATLRRFAARIDEVLFSASASDIDITWVPQLLAEARALDLVTDPAPAAPGHHLGVWGTHCQTEGLTLSLLTLSILAEACAGFATAVHAQGLACLALDGRAHFPQDTPLAAVFMPAYGLPLRPEGSGLHLTEGESGAILRGMGHFFLSAEPPQALICFAQVEGDPETGAGWVSLVLDAGAPGLELVDLEQRTGLRAASQFHLRCDRVAVRPEQILTRGDAALTSLKRVLACDWLGAAAIALGVARRSLRDSRNYAAQRFQGGRMIDEHASVQLLQGTAVYDISLLEAVLYGHAAEPLATIDTSVLLRWALVARLAVVEHAHHAVTNCLQTLGGYGYMEDYRLEKRLRDVSTLKSLHGAPDQLKLLLNEVAKGESP